jgi:predicted dehydrogenase
MGKSLYAEKPLATSIEDCKAVVTAAKQAKGTFQAGFQLRHDPNRNAGEALIHSGKIGKVLMCHGIRHGGDLPRDIPWYFDKTRTGDIIVDQGIHILDLFRWAIGTAPKKVAGFGGINLFVNVPPGRTVMDNYTLAIEYPGGERVNFSHHYFDPPGFTSIQERVFCEGGAVDLAKGTWMPRERRSPPIPLETPDAGKDSTYMALKAFAESVRNKSLPINNAESAFLSTAQALMATKAVYEGRVVTWEEITRGA